MLEPHLGVRVVAKRSAAVQAASGHEEVLATAREVDELLVTVDADSKVELGVETELAGGDAVFRAEGLVLGETGVVGG